MKRKKRPQPPLWWNWDNDNCWRCPSKKQGKGCGGCSYLKSTMKGIPRFAKRKDLQNKERGKDNEINMG